MLILAFVANVNLLLFHPATWLLASEFIFIITFYYFFPALIPTLPLASRYIKHSGAYQSGLPTSPIFSNRVFQSIKWPVSPSILLSSLVLTMSQCLLGSVWSQQTQDDSQGLIDLFFFLCDFQNSDLAQFSDVFFHGWMLNTAFSCLPGACPFPSAERHRSRASSSQPLTPQQPLAPSPGGCC